jgi:hypothetical protein
MYIWYNCTCIVPDLHDDDTHGPVLYQIYMMMVHMYLSCTRSTWWWYTQVRVYHHYHVDLVQYRYIIMYIWYNTGICVSTTSCRAGTIQEHVYHHHHVDLIQYRYMCTIVPDLHDDGTHGPVLYQIYMMMIHMYLYCTRSTWWWYTCTCIVPDLYDDDAHGPVLYQIYMMMVHVYHHHVDLVQYRYMCTIIM